MPECSRRRALQAVAGGAVGTVAGCLDELALSSSSNDPSIGTGVWPQARADARNTGTSEVAAIPSDPPERDWQFDVEWTAESGSVYQTYGVVVGDGTLYTAVVRRHPNRRSVPGGTTERPTGTPDRSTTGLPDDEPRHTLEVYALDAGTGDRSWQREVELGRVSTKRPMAIALSDAALHLVSPGLPSDDGKLAMFTFDRADGSVQRREVPLWSNLTVGESRLYGVGIDADGEQPGYFGVDPATGDVEWRANTDEISWTEIRLAVAGDQLVGSRLGDGETRRLVAYSLDDGRPRWKSDPLARSQFGIPHAVGSGTVVALGDMLNEEPNGRVVGVDVEDGTTLFTHDVDGVLGHPPVIVDRMAVFTTIGRMYGDGACVLHGVDLSDGTLRYSRSLGRFTPGPPVSDGDRVLIPGPTATVVDPEDGRTLWRASTERASGGATRASRGDPDTITGQRTVYPGDGRLFGREDWQGTQHPVRGYGTR